MAFPGSESGRVGRRQYWIMFFANMVAIILLIGLAIGAAMEGSWGLAIIAFLLIAPVGLYFCVVMMRRCRDIGWPAALPWITFGLGIAASFFNFGSIGKGDVDALTTGMGVAWLFSMLDFGLMVALGVVRGREDFDYRQVFDGHRQQAMANAAPQRTGPRQPASDYGAPPPSVATGDSDAMDDAIARALDNYRRTGSATAPRPMNGSPLATRGDMGQPVPRQMGFGRKMV